MKERGGINRLRDYGTFQCAIIRGGRELYTVRIPWPVLEGIEGGGRSNGVNGINVYVLHNLVVELIIL